MQPYNSKSAEICWIVAAVFISLLGPRNQNEPSGIPPRGMLNSFKINLSAPFASRIQGFQVYFDALGGGLSMTGTSERTTLGNKLGHNLCGCQHSVSRLSRGWDYRRISQRNNLDCRFLAVRNGVLRISAAFSVQQYTADFDMSASDVLSAQPDAAGFCSHVLSKAWDGIPSYVVLNLRLDRWKY